MEELPVTQPKPLYLKEERDGETPDDIGVTLLMWEKRDEEAFVLSLSDHDNPEGFGNKEDGFLEEPKIQVRFLFEEMSAVEARTFFEACAEMMRSEMSLEDICEQINRNVQTFKEAKRLVDGEVAETDGEVHDALDLEEK